MTINVRAIEWGKTPNTSGPSIPQRQHMQKIPPLAEPLERESVKLLPQNNRRTCLRRMSRRTLFKKTRLEADHAIHHREKIGETESFKHP